MRVSNLSTVFYSPEPVPTDSNELQRFLSTEFFKIQAAITALSLGHLDKTTVAPTKPRDGDLRYADGTSWDPGSGAGIYWFNGSVWAKL